MFSKSSFFATITFPASFKTMETLKLCFKEKCNKQIEESTLPESNLTLKRSLRNES